MPGRPLAVVLALQALLAFALVGAVATALLSVQVIQRVQRDAQIGLETIGAGVIDGLALAVFNLDQTAIDSIGDALVTLDAISGVEVIDTDLSAVRFNRSDADDGPLWSRFLRQAPVVFDLPLNGRPVGTLRLMPSQHHVSARIAAALWELAVTTLLTVLLSTLAIGLLATRMVVRPLKQLSALAVSNSRGRPSAAAPVSDTLELRVLQESLESMARDLRTYSETLEAQVEERTRQLRESQRHLLEVEKMASLGSVVAGVAHEVNTPLGSAITIQSSAWERLRDLTRKIEGKTATRADMEEYLLKAEAAHELLHANLERAASLVASFKQVAADQSVEETRRINLAEYLGKILASLHGQIKHRLTLHVSVPESIHLETMPGVLWQVVSNLVLNASIHAYADKGDFWISASVKGAEVELVLRDAGNGVSPGLLDRIWEPFVTTRRGQGGTGLGLSIVHTAVHGKLGGRIALDSSPGQGCRFRIWLPLKPKSRATAQATAALPASLTPADGVPTVSP